MLRFLVAFCAVGIFSLASVNVAEAGGGGAGGGKGGGKGEGSIQVVNNSPTSTIVVFYRPAEDTLPATQGEILDLPSISVGPRTGAMGTRSEIISVPDGEIQFLALDATEVAFVDNPTGRADMPPAALAMNVRSFDVMNGELVRVFVNDDLNGVANVSGVIVEDVRSTN